MFIDALMLLELGRRSVGADTVDPNLLVLGKSVSARTVDILS
jgi:hypothetical protein